MFSSILQSERGVLSCLRHFYKRGRCFEMFSSILSSELCVLNCFRGFCIASDMF